MGNLAFDCSSTISIDRGGRVAVPQTPSEAERLAASIERAVCRDTAGGVQDLHVEVRRNGVRLTGRCRTYYMKQRAQHAAMQVPGSNPLTNEIEVT